MDLFHRKINLSDLLLISNWIVPCNTAHVHRCTHCKPTQACLYWWIIANHMVNNNGECANYKERKLSMCLSFNFLDNCSSNQLHSQQVCCWRPTEVQCQMWSHLDERFSRNIKREKSPCTHEFKRQSVTMYNKSHVKRGLDPKLWMQV